MAVKRPQDAADDDRNERNHNHNAIGWSDRGDACKLLVPKNPHYEMITKPFEWKFTRTDLAELLDRLRHRINTNRWAA